MEFVPEPCKIQKMCDKFVSTYPLTITFVTECIVTEEMCDKVFVFDFIPDQYKTQCVTELFVKIFF